MLCIRKGFNAVQVLKWFSFFLELLASVLHVGLILTSACRCTNCGEREAKAPPPQLLKKVIQGNFRHIRLMTVFVIIENLGINYNIADLHAVIFR